jgi:hypothetical protein
MAYKKLGYNSKQRYEVDGYGDVYSDVEKIALKASTVSLDYRSDNPSDIFVYDTSLDSDGGAWRHRTRHTSWYNETLQTGDRGKRREFPSVAIIVLDNGNDRIVIYDGDHEDMDMWMSFDIKYSNYNQSAGMLCALYGSANQDTNAWAVKAKNGQIWMARQGAYNDSGHYGAVNWIDFLEDAGGAVQQSAGNGIDSNMSSVKFVGNIAQRNSGGRGYYPNTNWNRAYGSANRITGYEFLDVALTVLPDAPKDPVTGIERPTVALASESGVTILHNDGTTTYDMFSTSGYTPIEYIDFDGAHRLWVMTGNGGNATSLAYVEPERYLKRGLQHNDPNDTNWTTYENSIGMYDYRLPPHISEYVGPLSPYQGFSAARNKNQVAWGIAGSATGIWQGISLLHHRKTNVVYSGNRGDAHYDSMIALIGRDFATGWHPADIRMSINNTITGQSSVQGINKVADPRFISGHGFGTIQSSATVTHDSTNDWATVTSSGGSNIYAGREITGLEVGKTYWFYVNYKASSAHSTGIILNTAWANTGTAIAGSNSLTAQTYWQTLHTKFTATGTSVWLNVYAQGTVYIDNLFVIEAVNENRAIDNHYPALEGTMSKSVVASGAQLEAYHCTNEAKWLYFYDSTVNFPVTNLGTDWTFATWLYRIDNSTWDMILSRSGPKANHGDGIGFRTNTGGGSVGLSIQMNGTNLQAPVDTGAWRDWDGWDHIVITCETGVGIKVYHGGQLIWSSATTVNFDLPDNTYYWAVGTEHMTSYNMGASIDGRNKQMALTRLAKGAIDAENVKLMYGMERKMFTPNTKVTLDTSTGLTRDMQYDPVTGHLIVAHDSGRKVFDDLVLIDQGTTAVGHVSASNGLIVEGP